jgi:hypothetical protein
MTSKRGGQVSKLGEGTKKKEKKRRRRTDSCLPKKKY